MTFKEMEELRDAILNISGPDTIIFENPCYETAFIGISHDGRAIYDYNLMVEYLMNNDDMTYEDAVEFIDYNTIRALPYLGDKAPIIKMDIE